MQKNRMTTVLLFAVLLLGIAIMLYPTVSDYWNSFHSSRAIASYSESVSHIDPATYKQVWNEAVEYNKTLLGRPNPFYLSEEERQTYLSILDVSGTGMMGYINIPKINCELPLYHTTEESVLQIAVGHIEGSSLPVGGESTHCVVSGHRGLPSAKLFTHLDRMEEGDTFIMQILDETLVYEVDQIRIVDPDVLDDLYIEEGQDLCTLVTCTPYGINSHRLLIRGHRVATTAAAAGIRVTADAMRLDPLMVAPAMAAPLMLMLLIWLFTGGGKPNNRRKKAAKTVQNTDNNNVDNNEEKGGIADGE